jgi:phosphoketolase
MSTLTSNISPEISPLTPYGETRSTITGKPLGTDELRDTNVYWRACNYLSLGMIYLFDNALLAEPLRPEHIKNRQLGHWGSSPGLSFIYVHLNRLIKKYDLDMIFLAGPGHGAPGVLGPAYLEGTYSEVYPEKSQDPEGLREFFRQFSFPGGIGSHCTPETPGSIHEGGELGYVLSHACGAAFDNPELIVAAVVGDGESETGPLATSWHVNKFLNPARDGAVLPILHLNGYKINNPTLPARITHEELESLLRGCGWTPYFVEGCDPESMHQAMAATVEHCVLEIREHQAAARTQGAEVRPRWPMIVLRSPKGWTAPRRSRRSLAGGLLARSPGAAAQRQERSRATSNSRGLDAVAEARGVFRWQRQVGSPTQRLAPSGNSAHERESSCEWRTPQESLALAGFSRVPMQSREARDNRGREHASAGRLPARRDEAEHEQLSGLRSGRNHVEQTRGDLRGQQEILD